MYLTIHTHKLCFSGKYDKKMAALASDWLRHFPATAGQILTNLSWKQKSTQSLGLLQSFYFSCLSVNKDDCPGNLIGLDIFYFFSASAEHILTKLGRKQILNVFYQVCVFQDDRSTKVINGTQMQDIRSFGPLVSKPVSSSTMSNQPDLHAT